MLSVISKTMAQKFIQSILIHISGGKMKFKSLLFSLCCIGSANSFAGTVEVGPVYLDSVGVIGSSAFGHQAGNMEIQVTNGIGSTAGVVCSPNYIATKSTAPNFNQMLSILLVAQSAQKPVRIGITDDPTLTAFSGRCSLVSVILLK
jgi:hypothetical protein